MPRVEEICAPLRQQSNESSLTMQRTQRALEEASGVLQMHKREIERLTRQQAMSDDIHNRFA